MQLFRPFTLSSFGALVYEVLRKATRSAVKFGVVFWFIVASLSREFHSPLP